MLNPEGFNNLIGIADLHRKGHFIDSIAYLDLLKQSFRNGGMNRCLIKIPVDAFEKAKVFTCVSTHFFAVFRFLKFFDPTGSYR